MLCVVLGGEVGQVWMPAAAAAAVRVGWVVGRKGERQGKEEGCWIELGDFGGLGPLFVFVFLESR